MTDRSVLKALAVLDALGEAPEGRSLSGLSKSLGFPVSTMHRLLATLQSQGYVHREPDTGRYVLGHAILRLQAMSASRLNLTRTAFPELRALADRIDEAVNLGTLSGAHLVYLESVPANRNIGLYTPPGTLAPAHCTSMGKVLLAHLTGHQLDIWLAEHPLIPATVHSISDPDEFKRNLSEIREQGYAIDDGEWVSGVRCVAAPLRNHKGEVIAAVSVSASSVNLAGARQSEVAENLISTAGRISKEMGHRVPEAAT